MLRWSRLQARWNQWWFGCSPLRVHTVCELMGPPRSPEQISSEQTGGQEFKSVLSPPGGATVAAGRSHLCRGPETLGGQPGGAGPVQACKCSMPASAHSGQGCGSQLPERRTGGGSLWLTDPPGSLCLCFFLSRLSDSLLPPLTAPSLSHSLCLSPGGTGPIFPCSEAPLGQEAPQANFPLGGLHPKAASPA